MIRKSIAAALIFTALCAGAAPAQGVDDKRPGGEWSLILITDGHRAATSQTVLMKSEAACLAAASSLTSVTRGDIHLSRVAYCVSVATGEVATVRQD